MLTNTDKNNTRNVMLIIVFLAATLRILGIWHGYPFSFYPDEAHFVKRALSFGSFDFNPHWFHKPPFYMYLLFVEYGAYFVLGLVFGLWSSTADFAVFYINHPGTFYLIGRMTTVLFAVGSIWVVYRIGEQHFGKHVGVVSSLLLTLTQGHIIASQDVKADMPATFFAIVSMAYLLRYLHAPAYKVLIVSAAMAGIGAATKIYPIVMLGAISLGILCVRIAVSGPIALRIRQAIAEMCASHAVFWASYFVCAPFNFIDPLGREATFSGMQKLISAIETILGTREAQEVDHIEQKMSRMEGILDYVQVLVVSDGLGVVVGGITIAGILYLSMKINTQRAVFLAYPLVFVVTSIFLYPGYAESRHQLPIYPFLAIGGGLMLVTIAGSERRRKQIVYGGLLCSLMFPLSNILDRGFVVSQPDTRTLATSWIMSQIPQGSRVILDENGPQLLKTASQLQVEVEAAWQADPNGQFTSQYGTYLGYQMKAAQHVTTYDIPELRFPWWRESEGKAGVHVLDSEYDRDMGNPLRPVGINEYAWYVNEGYEYTVVNSLNIWSADSPHAKRFPSFAKFYAELFQKGKLIKEFHPEHCECIGPVVSILALRY